jgi:phage-related protein
MKLHYYRKANGKEPVIESIDSLEKVDRVKITNCLKEVQREGLLCTKVIFRQIQGKLWEIKIKTSSGGYRIFYVMIKEEDMVLLHMYKKQSQKAPRKEIETAMKRMYEVFGEFKE